MKKKNIIIVVVLLLLLGGGGVAYYMYSEYNRETKNAGEVDFDVEMTASGFVKKFNSFETDEKAMAHFNGKVIRISGEVSSVSENGKTFDILLASDDPMTFINVNLDGGQSDKAKSLKEGDQVTLQGFCTGKLMDIEFNRGVIIA